MNEILQSTIAGVVEGLTEFIPVSSTGHLILVGELIQLTGEKAKVFEVFIQLGAILAAAVLYRERFKGLFDFASTTAFRGRDGILKLIVACLPAAFLGLAFHHYIKEHLFGPITVAIALIAGGLVMIIVERRIKPSDLVTVEQISLKQCLLIGIFQAASLCPGVSRSAATIIGGMLVGLPRKIAAEFSFLVAVPLLSMAAFYDLYKNLNLFSASDLPQLATGLVVSFIMGALAIKFLINVLSKWDLVPFAIYRIVLGIIVIASVVQ